LVNLGQFLLVFEAAGDGNSVYKSAQEGQGENFHLFNPLRGELRLKNGGKE
jgi:hypothetical protein